MTVFIDTGVFYAARDSDAERHTEARDALASAFRGTHGRPYTSDYVYDEAVTLTRSRTGRFRNVVSVSELIVSEDTGVELLWITRDLFFAATETHRRYDDHELSFTDATTITLVERRNIDSVLSFDDDFDGLVDRLEPADA